jgi:hypothetical protein
MVKKIVLRLCPGERMRLCKIMRLGLVSRAKNYESRESFASAAFAELDLDSNGYIGRGELSKKFAGRRCAKLQQPLRKLRDKVTNR